MLAGCFPGLLLAAMAVAPAAASICTPTHYAANEIAAAVAASSIANPDLKSSASVWGAVGVAESQGDLCASNGYAFGVLQLARINLPPRMAPADYLAQSLQQQVDIWAEFGNRNTFSIGYQVLVAAAARAASIGPVAITSGMVAACFQFGPTICNNDVAALQSGAPCGGAHPVNINRVARNPGAATTDGNGQSICSWGGGGIQANIDAGAAAEVWATLESSDPAPASAVYQIGAAPGNSVLALGAFSLASCLKC